MKKVNLVLILLCVGIFIGCKKDDLKMVDNTSPIIMKVSGTSYYSVSQWTNANGGEPGLKEVLASIVPLQYVQNSVIQLTNNIIVTTLENSISVPANTTITGGGGVYGEGGFIIYGCPDHNQTLFLVTKENVCFRQLKIEGPFLDYHYNPTYVGIGGIDFEATAANAKVVNCDIYGFPFYAIAFRSENNEVTGCRIHDNYMWNDAGYGVLVSDGGDVYIHHNYFDNNQHAISGGGMNSNGKGSSYHAYFNVFQDTKGKLQDHCLDMHGNTDANDNFINPFAGNTIEIDHNNFYLHGKLAIGIRGIPQNYCYVHDNGFLQCSNINSAVGQFFEYYWSLCGNHCRFNAQLFNFVDMGKYNIQSCNMIVVNNVLNGYQGSTPNQGIWVSGQ